MGHVFRATPSIKGPQGVETNISPTAALRARAPSACVSAGGSCRPAHRGPRGCAGALLIEITCKDASHASIPPFSSMPELACPMNRMPSPIHEMDVRLPASGPPRMTGVLISTRPRSRRMRSLRQRKVDFLAPGDQRHVLLNLLNQVARHGHHVFHCWLILNAHPFN
jgi:hypothetical protein